ncbi:tyrosine-protein phosphatase [Sporosarcina sp. ITBMC105]
MIDMHSHILYNVDDGPVNLDGTLAIVEAAVKEGITEMIATPHASSPQYDVPMATVIEQVAALSTILYEQGIPLAIHAGQEVRLHENLVDNLKVRKLLTLANSRYVLLELPSQTVPIYTVKVIEQLVAEGYVPIIAHPERNRAIAEKPERLQRLIRHGAFAQVTAGSVSGHFGKGVQDLALRLIEANCIHTYGSDVHNTDTRPLAFAEGLTVLEKKRHSEIIEILLENNERILDDRQLIHLEMDEVRKKQWWKIGIKS